MVAIWNARFGTLSTVSAVVQERMFEKLEDLLNNGRKRLEELESSNISMEILEEGLQSPSNVQVSSKEKEMSIWSWNKETKKK